ncbi:SDR family oxidoreductase [Mucilaginibacter jinjuensis]|uniref:SDR family NAD(P)-dependent oxidoreductase n=1 Tax=Mucilaginibacter jinjuensis TaxID=1176721 RepID=A0ABY7TBL5_9SPHI|nr:SDR family NAD(P)-dependent oxidoreductase [Mucilaginibacter jinjuensis]WCT13757.1 SDR family NAD(P)-dependent oxidoreductase [Mucilaginibacter jinjuensis]
MNSTNKTVLITGGGSRIGFQTAKLFSGKGSKVIIVGRNEAKLQAAAKELNNVDYFVADVTNEADVDRIVEHIQSNYPSLDVLINNAAAKFVNRVGSGAAIRLEAAEEMNTNYISVINLTERLLPILKQQQESAVINITTAVALVPSTIIPTYSASKAALRSYTQALRFTLELDGVKNVKVFEVLPPLVNTELSKDNGGERGIAPEEVANDLLAGLENDNLEVRVSVTEGFYQAFFGNSANAIVALYKAERGESFN